MKPNNETSTNETSNNVKTNNDDTTLIPGIPRPDTALSMSRLHSGGLTGS
ncbi:hypothetical protein [Paenibacillus chitinolyticus]